MGKAIGINLGTTNSVVAMMESGSPVVIPTAADVVDAEFEDVDDRKAS